MLIGEPWCIGFVCALYTVVCLYVGLFYSSSPMPSLERPVSEVCLLYVRCLVTSFQSVFRELTFTVHYGPFLFLLHSSRAQAPLKRTPCYGA